MLASPPRATLAAVTAFTVLAACGDAPVAPITPNALRPHDTVAALRVLDAGEGIERARGPALGTCDRLRAPAGSQLTFHTYAAGVQIYRWTGTSWAFVAPEADLFADAGLHGHVGTHYAGPTWRSTSGSTVVGTVADRCAPDASAIPWLRLDGVGAGPGVFAHVRVIQRVNTAGGLAPTVAGSVVGQEARVPYTAEYFFYERP